MTQTTNFGLNLFSDDDLVQVANLNANTQKLDALPNVVTGTYTGTDLYGAANKVTLSFDRRPVLFLVASNQYLLMSMRGMTHALTRFCDSIDTGRNHTVPVSWQNHSLSFYSADNADYMCNGNRTYHYLAVLADEA